MKTNSLNFRRIILVVSAVFVVIWTQPALSSTVTFFGLDDHIYQYSPDFSSATPIHPNSDGARNTFLGTLGAYQYDNVETPASTHLTFGGSGVTADVANSNVQATNFIVPTTGSYATSGIQSLLTQGTGNGSPMVFDFNRNINAFGAYIIQLGDSHTQTLSLQLENTAHPEWLTTVSASPVGPYANDPTQVFSGASQDDVFFFGFTDDTHTYNKITLLKSDVVDNEGYLVDDVYVRPLPEPSSIVMAAFGLGMLGFIVYRRRSQANLGDCA